jgi:glycosyltransferase involved in cell wall biosynthesis
MRSSRTSGTAAQRVSCVIPVYNEGKRISGVLAAIIAHPLVSEVIVVDDGSTDETVRIVRATEEVRLVALDQNRGKSWALHAGMKASTGQVLLLVDGDLIGLTAAHITALISPVIEGRADISMSLRENTPRLWRLIGLDYISGERVMMRDLLDNRLEAIQALPKFGFEVFLNGLCIERKCRIAIVPWKGVRSPFKNAKYGFLSGVLADIRMISDIFRSASPFGLLHQILAMLRLRVKPSP